MPCEQIHFVTGKLAEHSLRELLADLAPRAGFECTVEVLNITVAALMTTEWVSTRIHPPPGTTRILLPGYCQGELTPLTVKFRVPVERGPRDLRRLPEFFGRDPSAHSADGKYDIEIIAEINHAPRMTLREIVAAAATLKADGADVIDVGCNPGETWPSVGECVAALIAEGHRVSIDSMNVDEISAAVRAGASLVLSVNSANCHAAGDWGCEVVVVPDEPATLAGLDETVEYLAARAVRLRIDPVLEPIGFGFAASMGRYLTARARYPDAEMMMGIGNLTELTDADSAAINVLLLAFCQELGIRSVLTTQVINWAKSSVKECDLARRLVYYAIQHRALPKHIEPRLVPLRGETPKEFGSQALQQLANQIRDYNFRIFAEDGLLHALAGGHQLMGTDPFRLFEQMQSVAPKPIDAGHAFYLGYELAKAVTALTLNKEYRQDEALDWGYLTRPETSHRSRND
jgi:dihydropteroate synthase-like protein